MLDPLLVAPPNESIQVCSVWGNRVCEGHSETDGWEQRCIACCATTTTHLHASSHSMSLRIVSISL